MSLIRLVVDAEDDRAGETSGFWRNAGLPNEVNLGNTDVVALDPGDIIYVTSGGGGGWGDPWERAPQAVLDDVRQGKVSVETAARDYGVVIRADGRKFEIDVAATRELRDMLAGVHSHASHRL